MATPESKVKKEVTKILDKYNVYYFFPSTHGYGRSGIPDIVALHEGKFIAIETKAGKNEPTALQKRELFKIKVNGGYFFVINENNLKDLESFFDDRDLEENV